MDTKYHEQYIRFGLKVQYYRKLSGMTQEAFADEIGKSWSFVAKIESPTRPFWRLHGDDVQDCRCLKSSRFKSV